jgi:lysophospholipase L1-like esterase
MSKTIESLLFGPNSSRHNVRCFYVRHAVLGLMLANLWAISANAQTTSPPAKPKKPHPSLVQVKDVPGLPRVLLIGDSVSMWYTLPVRKLLEGQANVHRPPLNCHHSRQVLAELDDYLGTGHWDVIVFNCGGHDISHRVGDAYAPPPEGKIQVPLDEYQDNLRAIVKRLKQTGAKLIWVSTTPMSKSYLEKGHRRQSDLLAYNEAAAEIMKEAGITIDDVYTLTRPNAERLLKDGVHFTPEGSEVLAKEIVTTIRRKLSAAKSP